jgi:HEAT repeat protein
MSILSFAWLALLLPVQLGPGRAAGSMQSDVARLVRTAQTLSGTWPSQAPPSIPEVGVVARHGTAVVPLLIVLLSDDPAVERDRRRWKVQQQVALVLGRIYGESLHCGRAYCDGDPPERIARVRQFWLRVIASRQAMEELSTTELLHRFKEEKVFWRQFELGRALAAANDRRVIPELEAWLIHDDRHVRGNVAFVLGRLGDPRGFDTIAAILADRSPRLPAQGLPGAKWTEQAQIRSDRYYAAHLLGDLQDRRGVALLIRVLNDEDIRYVAPWALAEIADRRAIAPLIRQTERDDPSMRVLAIGALAQLHAREALPRLRALRKDTRRSNFGERTSVAEAATRAIAVLSHRP